MKSYTDIKQSRKLAEFLPIESADMYYPYDLDSRKILNIPVVKDDYCMPCIHCWSLAALLELIPNFNMFKRTIECKIETTNHSIDKAGDLIDAAFEMVCWLKAEEYI